MRAMVKEIGGTVETNVLYLNNILGALNEEGNKKLAAGTQNQ